MTAEAETTAVKQDASTRSEDTPTRLNKEAVPVDAVACNRSNIPIPGNGTRDENDMF